MPHTSFRATAITLTVFAAACAGTPPDDGAPSYPPVTATDPRVDPGAEAASATLIVAAETGTVLWFERTLRQERRFRRSAEAYVSEVCTLWSAEVVSADEDGADLVVRFARVRGHVDDGERLEFDTAGLVPRVYCRLDDVRGDIALHGVEAHVTIAPDGRVLLRSALGADDVSTPALSRLALLTVRTMLGDDVRRGEPIAAGDSWVAPPAPGLDSVSMTMDMRTTVGRVGADAVVLTAKGRATVAPPTPGDADDGASRRVRRRAEMDWAGTLTISRRDGLVVHAEHEQRNVIGITDDGFDMENRIHSVTKRVPAPN